MGLSSGDAKPAARLGNTCRPAELSQGLHEGKRAVIIIIMSTLKLQ